MKKRFKIEGLDCANCALELERKVQKLTGVKAVSINFITQKMEIEYDELIKEDLIQDIRKIIKKEEPDVKIEEIK